MCVNSVLVQRVTALNVSSMVNGLALMLSKVCLNYNDV